MRLWIFALTLYAMTMTASAQVLQLESEVEQARLLELYTSEGCSSCPPADRWLGRLQSDRRLWKELVPVAFHVDYWDFLGWEDRFAAPGYGDRQRRYARHGNVQTVYTPGFVLNGREWRAWFRNKSLPEFDAPAVGKLSVAVDGDHSEIVFDPVDGGDSKLVAHLTLLGFELETAVGAGENRGRVLEHDFAVLGYQQALLKANDGAYSASMALPNSDVEAARFALAVWVTADGDVDPLQATGGWLPR